MPEPSMRRLTGFGRTPLNGSHSSDPLEEIRTHRYSPHLQPIRAVLDVIRVQSAAT